MGTISQQVDASGSDSRLLCSKGVLLSIKRSKASSPVNDIDAGFGLITGGPTTGGTSKESIVDTSSNVLAGTTFGAALSLGPSTPSYNDLGSAPFKTVTETNHPSLPAYGRQSLEEPRYFPHYRYSSHFPNQSYQNPQACQHRLPRDPSSTGVRNVERISTYPLAPDRTSVSQAQIHPTPTVPLPMTLPPNVSVPDDYSYSLLNQYRLGMYQTPGVASTPTDQAFTLTSAPYGMSDPYISTQVYPSFSPDSTSVVDPTGHSTTQPAFELQTRITSAGMPASSWVPPQQMEYHFGWESSSSNVSPAEADGNSPSSQVPRSAHIYSGQVVIEPGATAVVPHQAPLTHLPTDALKPTIVPSSMPIRIQEPSDPGPALITKKDKRKAQNKVAQRNHRARTKVVTRDSGIYLTALTKSHDNQAERIRELESRIAALQRDNIAIHNMGDMGRLSAIGGGGGGGDRSSGLVEGVWFQRVHLSGCTMTIEQEETKVNTDIQSTVARSVVSGTAVGRMVEGNLSTNLSQQGLPVTDCIRCIDRTKLYKSANM